MTLTQYTIEKTGETYRLTGPRGGIVRLIRSRVQSDLLFAVNRNMQPVIIDGCVWFSDKSGELKAVRWGDFAT